MKYLKIKDFIQTGGFGGGFTLLVLLFVLEILKKRKKSPVYDQSTSHFKSPPQP